MKLPLRIAFRYFSAHRKKSFISIISLVAMFGVGIGTMAMIVVLSVFNGIEELNRKVFRSFDPDIRITPVKGRRIPVSDSLLGLIRSTDGVKYLTQVVEDNALSAYDGQRMIVRLKGVDSSYSLRNQIDTAMIEGSSRLLGNNGTPFALIAEGVRNTLQIPINDVLRPMELWYPRMGGRAVNLSSTNAFNKVNIRPGGAFFLESRYDDFVIIPLDIAANLMSYGNMRTSLEIQVSDINSADAVQRQLKKLLGSGFLIENQDEQNADLMRAIRIEKLFVAFTISLIILVAGLNIFFSLSMLVLEKSGDIKILSAMGATPMLIRKIFFTSGAMVAFLGAALGMVLGVVICLVQQKFGIVSMGMATALVDAYPVKFQMGDLIFTILVVIATTLTVSILPAFRAARLSAKSIAKRDNM